MKLSSVGVDVVNLRAVLMAIAGLWLCSCESSSTSAGADSEQPPVPAPNPPADGLAIGKFSDISSETGIEFIYGLREPKGTDPEAFAGGVAAGDVNNDGLTDLFVVQGDIGPNHLYINLGNNKFADLAEDYGVAYTAPAGTYRHSGPTLADMDGDGYIDLFIGAIDGDPVKVFRNEGGVSFVDVTESSGLGTLEADFTISAAFGDYDLDGDLDLALAHWGVSRPVLDDGSHGDTETLWQNESIIGEIKFTSASVASGIAASVISGNPGVLEQNGEQGPFDYSFTPTFARLGSALHPDLLLVADFNNTKAFINNGERGSATTFTDRTSASAIVDENGMGSAVADFDNDGDLDWFVTGIRGRYEIIGNRFYENTAGGTFLDATGNKRVADGGWAWAACAADFNLDGRLDIFHTNGWKDTLNGSVSADDFQNDQDRLFMQTDSGSYIELASVFGLSGRYQGRGVVCADFDNDGDTDIFVTHRDFPAAFSLWRNDVEGQNSLVVTLKGLGPNSQAANARIHLTVGGVTQMREIMIGSNFISQNSTEQIFGLGEKSHADSIQIEWPNGDTESFEDVAAGRYFYEQSN